METRLPLERYWIQSLSVQISAFVDAYLGSHSILGFVSMGTIAPYGIELPNKNGDTGINISAHEVSICCVMRA